MVAIALDKTWVVHSFYHPEISDADICLKTILIEIKNTMKTHGWTVPYSSDGTLLGTGADDYWVDYTDIVSGVGDHSWIVLQNDNICAGFSVCLDFSSASSYYLMTAKCCSSGYNADGTKSSRPTAIGLENTLLNNAAWISSVASIYDQAIMYSSTDGECTRIYWSLNPIYYTSCSTFIFDVPKNPPSWFSTPYVASIRTGAPLTYNYWCETSAGFGYLKTDFSGINDIYLKFASIGMTGALGDIQGHRGQDYAGNFIFSPVYLCSISGFAPGIYGEMFDLYWTTASFCPIIAGSSGNIKSPGCLPSTLGDCGFQLFWHMAQGNDGIGRGLI